MKSSSSRGHPFQGLTAEHECTGWPAWHPSVHRGCAHRLPTLSLSTYTGWLGSKLRKADHTGCRTFSDSAVQCRAGVPAQSCGAWPTLKSIPGHLGFAGRAASVFAATCGAKHRTAIAMAEPGWECRPAPHAEKPLAPLQQVTWNPMALRTVASAHRCGCPRASSTPTVSTLWFVQHLPLNVAGDVAGDQRCPRFLASNGLTCLYSVPISTLLVVQTGPVGCARNAVVGVLQFGAGIDPV